MINRGQDAELGNFGVNSQEALTRGSVPPSFIEISKHKGKRQRTRASLLDATARLLAERGLEDITIRDITVAAGIASGTFYNHFRTKGEIIAETAFRIIEQISLQIHHSNRDLDDPLRRIVVGARCFVSFSVLHPTWAWALLRSVEYLPNARKQIYRFIATAVHFGAESKRFEATEDEFTFEILINMMLATVRASLTGIVGAEAGPRLAEMQLRVLGVPPDIAADIAYSAIEPVQLGWTTKNG